MSHKKIIYAIVDHPFMYGLVISFIMGVSRVDDFSVVWFTGVIVAIIFYGLLNMYNNKTKDLNKGI